MRKNPVALITGSSNRVGREIALCLADKGYDIAVHYNASDDAAKETQKRIESLGRKAICVQADLKSTSRIASLYLDIHNTLGPVSCLINNASIFYKDTLSSFSESTLSDHFAIHAIAPLFLIQSFALQLPKETPGNVINLLDGMWGWSMSPSFLTYSLSKMTLWNITTLLARELAPHIRINAIAPGSTIPGIQDKEDTFEKIKQYVPLKRNSSPEEVCNALRYLLEAPSVTGQVIELGGGSQTLKNAFF
jgi:NAD(P)-dependent dehydrogenase (short-subunit alcohol dehydrogenase family)